MNTSIILSHLSISLSHFMLIVVPPLGAAVFVGLAIGLLQAATQIQDQTLPQIFKLFSVIAVFALLAPLLSEPLLAHANELFGQFPEILR